MCERGALAVMTANSRLHFITFLFIVHFFFSVKCRSCKINWVSAITERRKKQCIDLWNVQKHLRTRQRQKKTSHSLNSLIWVNQFSLRDCMIDSGIVLSSSTFHARWQWRRIAHEIGEFLSLITIPCNFHAMFEFSISPFEILFFSVFLCNSVLIRKSRSRSTG